MRKSLFIFMISLLLFFVSCRKEELTPDDSVTPAMARDSLFYIMKEWYYWYNLMPDVTKESYSDPYELMEAMRYSALDRWSFVADYDEFLAEMQGTFVGHGFRIGVDNSGNARIAMIYSNSPLYANGVRRGWIVKKINDVEVAPIILAGDAAAYSSLIGPGEAGITNSFLFIRPDDVEITISSTKSTFTVNSVILYDTLHLSSGITGHLVFESFIYPSESELATAFAFFRANNIEDLILDLRYNPGGYLHIALMLANYIAGDSNTGAVFTQLQYNDKHHDANYAYYLQNSTYPLSLSRVIVITSRSTASASEAVINGLDPFIDIITIGDTTNGKPTGMNGWDIGEKYYFWPVTFKMVNSLDEGDYFDGIYPDRLMTDDITRDFNNRQELCLKEAISYLEKGSFSTKGDVLFSRASQFTERDIWFNNAFFR